MITRMPFLFYLPERNDYNAQIGVSMADRDTWYVKVACFDMKAYASAWMCDDDLGAYCLVPDVDLCEESHAFYSEQEALSFMREWWMTKSDKI